jgi:hypothetical protein
LQKRKMKYNNYCKNEHDTTNVARNKNDTKWYKEQRLKIIEIENEHVLEMKTTQQICLELKLMQRHKTKENYEKWRQVKVLKTYNYGGGILNASLSISTTFDHINNTRHHLHHLFNDHWL